MSSHREAPEISQGSGCRQRRRLCVRQPGQPEHRHDHHQLRAAAGPGRRPELLRVRRRRPLLDLHRQRRRRQAGDRVPVPVQLDPAEPEHVPLQHRADRLAHRPELELRASSTRSRGSTQAIRTARHRGTSDWNAGSQGGRRSQRADQRSTVLGTNLPCPPCNIGPLSTPNYEATSARRRSQTLANAARRCSAASGPTRSTSTSGRSSTSATCGRSSRPMPAARSSRCRGAGVERDERPEHPHDRDPDPDLDADQGRSRRRRTRRARPRCSASGAAPAGARCGCSTTRPSKVVGSGPWVQVSRLGNPLFNEVIVPLGKKDDWNRDNPVDDSRVPAARAAPRARRAPAGPLPGRVPEPGCAGASRRPGPTWWRSCSPGSRGVPLGAGFQNYTGPTNADMLRLNVGDPTDAATPSILGILGGDLAGLPERPAGVRRHRDDRAPRDRRAHLPARRLRPLHVRAGRGGSVERRPRPRPRSRAATWRLPVRREPYDGYDTPRLATSKDIEAPAASSPPAPEREMTMHDHHTTTITTTTTARRRHVHHDVGRASAPSPSCSTSAQGSAR